MSAGLAPVDYSTAPLSRTQPGGGRHCSHSMRQLQLAVPEPVGLVPGQSAEQCCSRKERHSPGWYLERKEGKREIKRTKI